MLLVALLPVPMLLVALLDGGSVPVPSEENELVAPLLAVELVPVLDSDAAVIVEPDVMLAVALDEDPVPILLEELALVERDVPVTLNGSVMTVKLEDPVAMPGNGQQGRHTHSSVGGETSANKT